MLIKYHHVVREKKGLLLLVIIDILKEYSSPEHHMKKTELCEKIEQYCGFPPARNTVYDKLNSLEYAGFPIVQDKYDGVYYDGHELSDGELRFLVDSVLYSDFVTLGGADEMIEALTAFGSPEFQKYIRKQKNRAEKTRKNMQKSVFFTIEEVQSAIFSKRQISCNYLTYRADLTTENVYPEDITVNPYELVYKNGKYYLLGSLNEHDKILSWRVDRLCNIKILETRCQEIPQLKEINASGGMSAYADTQPDLCGGAVETFKIQCAKDSIDEIVDVFGSDFSIAPEQKDNYDDETIILSVKATRESMKSWAFTHAGSMVVISPDDFRKDIADSLKDSERLYRVTGKPLHVRVFTAKDFAEAIRFSKKRTGKTIIYHGKGRYLGKGLRSKEKIDLSLLHEIPDIISLSLNECILDNAEYLHELPMLHRLHLVHCELPENMQMHLEGIEEVQTDDIALPSQICDASKLVQLTLLGADIQDMAFITQFPSIRRLALVHCRDLNDCSDLQDAEHIEELEISHCDKLNDYSFLKKMKYLKELRLEQTQMDADTLKQLKQRLSERGVRLYTRFLRDYHSEDMVIKPGIDPAILD